MMTYKHFRVWTATEGDGGPVALSGALYDGPDIDEAIRVARQAAGVDPEATMQRHGVDRCYVGERVTAWIEGCR